MHGERIGLAYHTRDQTLHLMYAMLKRLQTYLLPALFSIFLLSGCQSQISSASGVIPGEVALAQDSLNTPEPAEAALEPIPTRPTYGPGELVDYVAQSGDTLPALAIRFNTSVEEILAANTFIPASASTMPPGMPMKIPIYYLPLWGSSYRIIPDSQFIYGPALIGFDTTTFVSTQPGWLKQVVGFASGANRTGAELVDIVAINYSVSPRLLLALLEYQAGALSQPAISPSLADYPLGFRSYEFKGLYMQLVHAANLLNDNYAAWRIGSLTSMEYPDGRLVRFDPWLNASTASLHAYFNYIYRGADYDRAISAEGLARTFQQLFGDPWPNDQPHIPGSLAQPEFNLPFETGQTWAFTGGPHTAWGNLRPFSAIDFAPPSTATGCIPSNQWVTAVADGVVVRVDTGVVVLDLDSDGDERTGWNVFYLHVASADRAALGAQLSRGQPLGHPSCEGGSSTGTHVHIARKYNGEWIPAEGVLAFNMEGWVAYNGRLPYQGTLQRFSQVVTANQYASSASFIKSEPR